MTIKKQLTIKENEPNKITDIVEQLLKPYASNKDYKVFSITYQNNKKILKFLEWVNFSLVAEYLTLFNKHYTICLFIENDTIDKIEVYLKE
jgi:hypothetical protein